MTLKSKRRCANSNGLCNCCVSYHHLFSAFCPSYILKNHTLVHFILHFFTIIVQFLSLVLQFETQWTAACQVSLSFTISWSLLKLIPFESVVSSNHLILCHSLLFLPSIFPSVRVFANESALLMRQPKYWSFSSASVLPMNIQGQISLGLTGLISLLSNGLLKVPSSTTIQKHHFSVLSLLYGPTLTSIHDHWKKKKTQL